MARTSAKEPRTGCHEPIGALDVGQVAAVGNEGHGTILEACLDEIIYRTNLNSLSHLCKHVLSRREAPFLLSANFGDERHFLGYPRSMGRSTSSHTT